MGYVYVSYNECFDYYGPNIYRIGSTTRPIDECLKESNRYFIKDSIIVHCIYYY